MDLNEINFSNIQAAEDKELSNEKVVFNVPCGAYIVEIINAEAKVASTGTKYIQLVLDVAEGAFKGFAQKAESVTGHDYSYLIVRAFYGTEKTNSSFKRLLDKLEESNRNFSYARWKKDCNEKDFIGLIFGVVLDEKLNEYNGKISKRVEPSYFKIYSANEIDEGKYQEPRRLNKAEKQKLAEYLDSISPSNESELPF